ncbi:MAG: 4-(cytidine 5'-diphospho)-2-C-methyl-D-erythritol kinase [Acidobacteria bacterium]|nr:4-(cytidine 5'-diphospho)-2-C-methyl-D-erythritol kinase [Acidobacteriota bacterium]
MRAPAKINLSLRVLGVSNDGYHDLRTVFQSIDLHDTLTFEQSPGPFRLICSDRSCPEGETNLVWRAADAIARAAGGAGPPRDIAIRLEKRIPMQAGLGGGSSDAAAVLRGFAALWGVQIPRERVQAIAARLGADVPYFLEGGAALGLGRGDLLFALADPPPAWVALVLHPFGVGTKEAYAWFDARRGPARQPPPLAARAGIVVPEAGNDLQAAVAARHPQIEQTTADLVRAGALYASMSGSGSAVFGLFATRVAAARAARRCALGGRRRALVVRCLNRAQYQALARA